MMSEGSQVSGVRGFEVPWVMHKMFSLENLSATLCTEVVSLRCASGILSPQDGSCKCMNIECQRTESLERWGGKTSCHLYRGDTIHVRFIALRLLNGNWAWSPHKKTLACLHSVVQKHVGRMTKYWWSFFVCCESPAALSIHCLHKGAHCQVTLAPMVAHDKSKWHQAVTTSHGESYTTMDKPPNL